MTTSLVGGRRVLVVATEVDTALKVARRVEEAGIHVRATTRFDDFVHHVQVWQPTHVAVAVGAGGSGRSGTSPGVTVIPGGVIDELIDGDALVDAGSPFRGWTTLDDLDDALDLGRLSAAYQPKIDTATGAVFAIEALARWHRPHEHSVPPDDFVTLAEISGRIERLTDVVFGKSIRWFARNLKDSSMEICLNLSGRSLTDRDLPDRLERMCQAAGLDPSRLVLEVTETSIASDANVAHDVLTVLRDRGLRVALDDFGAGHASLLQLARHPFTDLKIDRGLVQSAASESQSRTIIEAIVGLAENLDLRVIAEGVEDAATYACLQDLGCMRMQGNHLAPAMEPAAILAWLRDRSKRADG
jgi:EAL domain-containing protein (putative c-di-GMP-specific phosphodiesterase class I)